jgi:hypothetical protein
MPIIRAMGASTREMTPAQVSAIADPALRNLWITQTYHDLGVRLSEQGLGQDASWLIFAVWASKTAGRTIRDDDLSKVISDEVSSSSTVQGAAGRANRSWALLRLARLMGHLSDAHLHSVVDSAVTYVSGQIARGNLLVFSELAPFFSSLAAGEPAPASPGLETAAALYQEALHERDEQRRALLVLDANVRAVAHEQRRLQACIQNALSAPIEEGLGRILDEDVAPLIPLRLVKTIAKAAIRDIVDEMSTISQMAVTRTLMTLDTPDGSALRLHEDLPPPPGGVLFSPPLHGSEAAEKLRPWDRTGGAGNPCGAANWDVIQERMGYIVNLFRSRQRVPDLFKAPFSDDQLSDMRQGRLPSGPL